MRHPHQTRYDAVIVGARCAGAATAMLLARKGARVLVVDHDQPGTDTLSTHALMRAGVLQLHCWGVLDGIRAYGTPAVRKTSFHYGAETVEVEIAPAFSTDALYAPRRTVLDAALVAAARDAGAEFRFGIGCRGLVRDDRGRVTGAVLQSAGCGAEVAWADRVIGADGRRSIVAREVGAPMLRRSSHASAVVYGYFDGLPNQGYRWFWEPGAGGGIIPTNDGRSCVFLAMPPETFRSRPAVRDEAAFRAALADRMPVLAGVLAQAPLATPLVTFRGERGYIRQSQGSGWALVGDAGYFKDPITAHGITDALRDAEILAETIGTDDEVQYPQIRDRLSADFFATTDRIASYGWSFDSLKALHRDLNRAMKPSQAWVLGDRDALVRAA